jgi:katanin p60 ATPase-containing subunit A1
MTGNPSSRNPKPFTREPYRGRSDVGSDQAFKSSLRKGTTTTKKPRESKVDSIGSKEQKPVGPSGPSGSTTRTTEKSSIKRKPTLEEIKKHFAPSDHPFVDKIGRDILDGSTPSSPVTWSDVIGLESAKSILTETLLIRFYIPDFFHGLRAPTRGILLFGPPGTGKTMIVKAALSESGDDITFFNVSVTTLASKFHGESESLVRILFEMARLMSPSIVFMDEVDALLSTRGSSSEHEASRRVKTELLVQLDGLVASPSSSGLRDRKEGEDEGEEVATRDAEDGGDEGKKKGECDQDEVVLFIAATNLPWNADEALLRRVGMRIYVPLPTADGREKLIRSSMRQHKLDESLHCEDGLIPIVAKTDGYSASDVVQVCREASMMTLRRNIAGKVPEELKKLQSKDVDLPITLDDFMAALEMIKPSVSKETVSKYEKWDGKFGYRS